MTEQPDHPFSIVTTPEGRVLRVEGTLSEGFHGERVGDGYHCPLDAQNADAIRRALPWAAPRRVGMRKSVGLGDRLGLATVGHLRAVREGDMFPVLAQQSSREMARSGRGPRAVLDDATWGVVAADYRDGWGCDADHLKTTADIDAAVESGYLGFTLDPSEYVDDRAGGASPDSVVGRVLRLPWETLRSDPDTHRGQYTGEYHFHVGDYMRAAAKYGRAIAHIVALTTRLNERMGGRKYDLEISVDETSTPTTPNEHRYIVYELKRLKIPFTAIAPRFSGSFEKGVDYIGEMASFESSFRDHASLARTLGPYKLSIHSGSDKFSLYPIIARYANPYVHLKTAGTSWLEALRVIAAAEPALFRQMLALAMETFEANRQTYLVSAEPGRIPSSTPEADLLNQFDVRQVLHVGFGPLLAQFRDGIYRVLHQHAADYADSLHRHFRRHILPFRTETVMEQA